MVGARGIRGLCLVTRRLRRGRATAWAARRTRSGVPLSPLRVRGPLQGRRQSFWKPFRRFWRTLAIRRCGFKDAIESCVPRGRGFSTTELVLSGRFLIQGQEGECKNLANSRPECYISQIQFLLRFKAQLSQVEINSARIVPVNLEKDKSLAYCQQAVLDATPNHVMEGLSYCCRGQPLYIILKVRLSSRFFWDLGTIHNLVKNVHRAETEAKIPRCELVRRFVLYVVDSPLVY